MMKTKKLAYGGLLLALGILLPQVFHFTGLPQTGSIFLPMHIPIFLTGFLLGPWYGLVMGVLTPVVSSLITGMPPFARLPFMIGELAGYGFASGLLFHRLRLYRFKFGIYSTLLLSMVAGRAVYAAVLWFAANLFHIPCEAPIAAITSIAMGLPGILMQLIIVPGIIYLLRKSGFLNDLIKTDHHDY